MYRYLLMLAVLFYLPAHAAETKKNPETTIQAESDDDDSDEADDQDDESDASQGQALSANVTLTSDYILRGLSQTDHKPAIQGGFDWEHPLGIYAGVWGSSVHFPGETTSLELDGYAGFTHYFTDDWNAGLGLEYSSYFAGSDRNSWAASLKTQWKTLGLEVDYSPHWQEVDEHDVYFLASWRDGIFWDLKLGIYAGYTAFAGDADVPSYADFRVSLSREFFGVEWDVSGIFVNQELINDTEGGSRMVVSVSKSF